MDESPARPTSGLATPHFIYFDLGNVLLQFDHQRAARQMAAVANTTPERVWEVVFANDLEWRYERGELSTAQFHEAFCRATGTTPPLPELLTAASDIFELNRPIVSLLNQLRRNGRRVGLLSNTNEAHWSFVQAEYPELARSFEVTALSFELRSLKPASEIYHEAARRANAEPATVLFIDDRLENVTAARAASWDAIQFTGHQSLLDELLARGLGPLV